YYGIYNFAFFDFAHLESSPCPILFDGTNSTFLQDHFSLLLPLLSPLFWAVNWIFGTYTLLILQWLFIVYGGWATYKLITFKTGESLTGLLAMLCYFLLYSRFCSYQSDCNLAIFGSALIPAYIYYFETKKYIPLICIFLLLMISREDFPLLLIFINMFLMISHRKDKGQFKFAVLTFAFSLLFFVIIFKWIIPAFETDNKKFNLFNYAVLGSTPSESLLFILKHPIESVKLLFINHLNDPAYDWMKAKYYFVFGLAGGVLLFIRPHYLICLIPIIAKKMYNDDPLRWTHETYYGIETASVLPMLVFMALSEFQIGKTRKIIAVFLFALTITSTYYCFSTSNYPNIYSKFKFYESGFYKTDYPAKEIHQMLSLIPDGATMSASGRILPHLASRKNIYYFPNKKDNEADYICISLWGDTWPTSVEDYNNQLLALLKSKNWKAQYAFGNILLLKKVP
ncbi:MAG: DUF2079 domain-containing protein, partial [Bacteroidia bacterium]|nr:DUF2079 domain-containing protein [Bacteroidia bacterium]